MKGYSSAVALILGNTLLMARTVNIAMKLRKLAAGLEELAQTIDEQKKSSRVAARKSSTVRGRRSKKEATALKKLLKAERKAGVSVAELAKKYGISTAYIYMLR
ncbi:hypothetical protein [Aestuariivirga sp.]|uniref:hypothetical protein n=1 Tax=Aestuariivirga sp. TaxID=2650926 RepID=UPI003783E879